MVVPALLADAMIYLERAPQHHVLLGAIALNGLLWVGIFQVFWLLLE